MAAVRPSRHSNVSPKPKIRQIVPPASQNTWATLKKIVECLHDLEEEVGKPAHYMFEITTFTREAEIQFRKFWAELEVAKLGKNYDHN